MAKGKDGDTPKATAPGKEVALRRVYALPAEMVDRITEFQKDKGFASEVEAVRKLLDEALKGRDSLTDLINRFLSKQRSLRLASEVAKDVLVGHPLVTALRFGAQAVSFETKDGYTVGITDNGYVDIEDENRNTKHWHTPKGDRFGHGYISNKAQPPDFDVDDIPF